MEKQKKWPFFLILIVLVLTIYNILPTLFYYSNSLKSPVDQKKALEVAKQIQSRINDLEPQSISWLDSFCKLLNISPHSIKINKNNPQEIALHFDSDKDATKFKQYISRAGTFISFAPSQLFLSKKLSEKDPKKVIVQRKIPIQFSLNNTKEFFQFSKKQENNKEIAPLYKEIIFDRITKIAMSIAGPSDTAKLVHTILDEKSGQNDELAYGLALQINQFVNASSKNTDLSKRFFSFFLQGSDSFKDTIQNLSSEFDKQKDSLKAERIPLQKKEKELKEIGKFLSEEERQTIQSTSIKEEVFAKAKSILKKNERHITGSDSWSYEFAHDHIVKSFDSKKQIIHFNEKNPFIQSLIIDWEKEQISLVPYKDITKDTHQHLINEIARISRQSDEELILKQGQYVIQLPSLVNSNSFLSLNLAEVAKKKTAQIQNILKESWNPNHLEFSKGNFPILDYASYQKLPPEERSLCLLIYSPILDESKALGNLKDNSIYVIAKGLDKILKKYQLEPESRLTQAFLQDFYELQNILVENGFISYPGSVHLTNQLHQDYIFEKDNYYQDILAATRENFKVHGSKKFAILEFTDLEQRIITLNKIETAIHEDLLKWRDDYLSSQVKMDSKSGSLIPKPQKNIFFNNLSLSLKKYFRGDERKVIHWGLDLSGGKTVSIELRDQNNQLVQSESDISQGINELYNRVNKMGVSEVNIRKEGGNILLDFPGSQAVSASDLIKASSMTFHLVNEKFSLNNPSLSNAVDTFLQEIWNEAVVTNQKDIQSINTIAYTHLHGDPLQPNSIAFRSAAAKQLFENGLQLAMPNMKQTNTLNDALTKIGILKGKDFSQWQGQSHPLVFIFHNFVLDGSSLDNVRAGYDPSKGNFLSFDVKSSNIASDGLQTSPRSSLFHWTSQFSKEKIQGTVNETFSQGRGWRMAVILNDYIISSPSLDSPLKDSAMITGKFSQREINQLVSDLKAGSLTYTPKILSEKNVSPELGKQDRIQGIYATLIALIVVIIAMILYYRFAGLIAAFAVLFNLLIMWAILQNLHATLTLAGIAGVILTVGMAVDANVLVFERIKEEFALTNNIATAIKTGYKKAFSAILDSNITTIIAGIILLNFDSGPIKGFAVTLIIGITSSMFTALFMTRYFFFFWLKNPKHKKLTMSNFIRPGKFNFLKKAKFICIFSSLLIIVGAFSMYSQKNSIFGMDFTGGFSLNIELEEQGKQNYREAVESAFLKSGAKSQEFSIRELNPSNHLRVLLSTSLENINRPFHNLSLENQAAFSKYSYEKNPRIVWVVDSLNQAGIKLSEKNLHELDNRWSTISGQMSVTMRNQALFGLAIALLAILAYITIRFEFKFSISAMICLVHDVLATLGIIALLHFFNIPIQIDLHTIAAIMTIIGYSLNDTIIIFDRIREDLKQTKKLKWSEIINHALNATLSRTLITSATTLLVLIALIIFGGSSIFNFALVMAIGIVLGTLSSIFIASPLMLLFHNLEVKKSQKMQLQKQ